MVPMQCKRCNKDHDGQFGSGQFCSKSCANSRGPRSEDVKRKISKSLQGQESWLSGRKLTEEHKRKISTSLKNNPNRKNLGMNLKNRVSDDLIFIENSKVSRKVVKQRIRERSLMEYVCSCCNQDSNWNGRELILQLDHVNGVNNDNRMENLRFLCPNCHSQQETFAGRNVNRNLR